MSSAQKKLKYPFSREARETSLQYARDLKALADFIERPQNQYIVEEAEKRVYAAIVHSEIISPDMRDEKQVLVYSVARLIVEELGNLRLRALQAEAESKAVNRMLAEEDNLLVEELCSDSLGWKIESMGSIHDRSQMALDLRTFEYKIRFENFLEVAPSFNSEEWNLVNRYFDRGWVFIRRRELNRLVSGKFSQIIMSGRLEIPKILPRRLVEAIQRIEVEAKVKVPKYEPVEFTGDTSAFPPCMQKLHDDSVSGRVNLSHSARFSLAAFLLKIDMSREEVNKVFSHSPDSNTHQIVYQVDNIADKRSDDGKSTGYSPPGCKWLQTNGICPVYLGHVYDPLCEYILHPLSFYHIRARELSRQFRVTDSAWYARKREKKQFF